VDVLNPTTPEAVTPFIPVEANDVCYWKCDERTQNNGGTETDIVSGVALTQATITLQPRYAKGPGNTPVTQTGRYLYPSVTGFTSCNMQNTATPGAAAATFQGSWTVEMYIRPVVVAGTGTIIAYQNPGELLADNYQMAFRVLGGKLSAFWENGAGVNVVVTQVAGATMVVGTDYHVAIVKDTGTGNCLFYIDGTLQDTVAYGTNANGGTAANWVFGAVSGSTDTNFTGMVKDIKISNVARNAAYIAADAALKTTTSQQPTDANTVWLWRLTAAPDVADSVGTAPLFIASTTASIPAKNAPMLGGAMGYSRHWTGGGGTPATMSGPGGNSAIQAVSTCLRGDFTFDGLFFLTPTGVASTRQMFYLLGTGETTASNLFRISVDFVSIANGFVIQMEWEQGAGVNVTFNSPNNTITYAEACAWGTYIAITQTSSGANTVINIYVNGTLRATSGSLVRFDGVSTVSDMTLNLCGEGTTLFAGMAQAVRLKNVALSSLQIAQVYQHYLGLFAQRLP
jgi:hypothetical protein